MTARSLDRAILIPFRILIVLKNYPPKEINREKGRLKSMFRDKFLFSIL